MLLAAIDKSDKPAEQQAQDEVNWLILFNRNLSAFLRVTRSYGARCFPTFVFRYGEREQMLRGFQNFHSMQAVINSLSGGTLQAQASERTAESVLRFIRTYGRAAPVELATVFDLAPVELQAWLRQAVSTAGRQAMAASGSSLHQHPVATPRGICVL